MHHFSSRRKALRSFVLATAVAAIGMPALADQGDDEGGGYRQGKLFMSTNAAGGNMVNVYARATNGPAILLDSVATGGNGTGAGLGSQGAITLSTSGRYLFVVNAASHTVSTFQLGSKGMTMTSVVDSGGLSPISVTESEGLVYVLNAGGDGNVAGFRNERGVLKPVSGSARGLSVTTGAGPAQVAFDKDGDVLVISEKNTNVLTSYKVRRDGTLDTRTITPSAGAVPFGFAITKKNVVVVSEAAGSSASSYRIGERNEPALQLVSPAVVNGQGAACWIAVTPNGRFAYSANAATSNISSYAIGADGTLTLLAGQAGLTSGNGALDMATTPDGRQLHVFASRAPQQIVSFSISPNGSLSKIGALNVTAGAGLAAN